MKAASAGNLGEGCWKEAALNYGIGRHLHRGILILPRWSLYCQGPPQNVPVPPVPGPKVPVLRDGRLQIIACPPLPVGHYPLYYSLGSLLHLLRIRRPVKVLRDVYGRARELLHRL